ncbi:MAG: HAMP domain-containing histidine kinase [Gammaproteobacteria bacterium]|nr:HAMP domain-containing histidine kinase [Gammaproteobacteria bacterium]
MPFTIAPVLHRRYDHLVLAGMLYALHFALRAGPGSGIAAALLAIHLGLFFLWQPIWQRDRRLDPPAVLRVVLFTAVYLASFGWALASFWLILLCGLVAGRTIGNRRERIGYMLVLTYLVSELLVTCTAQLFHVDTVTPGVFELFRLLLPLLPLPLLLLRFDSKQDGVEVPIDFFRGVNFALMTALLAVSSVLVSYRFAIDYAVALFGTLLVLAGFLLLISWLLLSGGFGNLLHLWERSLLNVGTPFEQRLARLARLATTEPDPEAFLHAAVAQLLEAPGVVGAEWRSGRRRGRIGAESRYKLDFDDAELALSIHTRRSAGPMLLLHYRLLLQLIAHFHAAILRARDRAQRAHLQAIHETGARLTHDIKNLLQALQTLTDELLHLPETPSSDGDLARQQRGQQLLRRQLPLIAERLRLALGKLQDPALHAAGNGSLRLWWQALCGRYAGRGIQFSEQLEQDREVPIECLDSVVENLLDNALHKARAEPDITVTVTLAATGDGLSVEVRDDGSAIEPALATLLFQQVVASATGLGIGLYQAARFAERSGLRLTLASNRARDVRFTLTDRPVP